MSSKTYCPIMTIGFSPPEEGKRDFRLCMRDCAWYDVSAEKCKINVIAEHLEYIISCVDVPGDDDYEPEDYFDDPWDDDIPTGKSP